MFSKAPNLFALAVLASLGPIAAVQAQAATPVTSGDVIPQPVSAPASKVTWSPSDKAVVDSSLCVYPVLTKRAPARRTIKRTAPKLALTPGIKRPAPKPRIAAAKPKPILPPQPRLQCPQVELAPNMMGMLDSSESIIPMPGDGFYALADPEMPLVNPRTLPLGDIPTVAVANGGTRWGPLVWLFGGGAGITIFTKFLDGDDGTGGGRTPLIPNPPTVNPELPPVTTTPEPGTLILVGTGLAGMAGVYRRRRK